MNSLLELFKRLFSSLFPPTTPTDTDDNNTATDTGTTTTTPEEEIGDSSDLPPDSVVVTEVLPFEVEPGDIIDDEEKEEEGKPVAEEEEEEVVVASIPNRFMWCLDNGHGEDTPGKRSPEFEMDGITMQFFEYEFNRDVVGRIINALTEKGIKFFNVVPEVEGDITLKERVTRANTLPSNLPKIYVSVHSNAGPVRPGTDWTSASGMETWYYKSSSNGKKIASVFQKEMVRATDWRNRGLKSTALKNLYVLRHTSMPAVLTESGFFNNEKEVKKLMMDDVRQAIADAHVAAILEIEKNGIV